MEVDTHEGGHIEIDTRRWTHGGRHTEVDTKRKNNRDGGVGGNGKYRGE